MAPPIDGRRQRHRQLDQPRPVYEREAIAFDIPAPADPTPPRPAFDASSGIVGEDAVSAFEADGVVCLRRVVEPDELPAILAGCDEARGAPTSMATTIGGDDGPGFFFDFEVSDRIEAFRRLRDDGPMPDLARQLMRSERVVRYFDNPFVKDGGGGAATPWHEDASFQRVNGADSINFWLAFDDILTRRRCSFSPVPTAGTNPFI